MTCDECGRKPDDGAERWEARLVDLDNDGQDEIVFHSSGVRGARVPLLRVSAPRRLINANFYWTFYRSIRNRLYLDGFRGA